MNIIIIIVIISVYTVRFFVFSCVLTEHQQQRQGRRRRTHREQRMQHSRDSIEISYVCMRSAHSPDSRKSRQAKASGTCSWRRGVKDTARAAARAAILLRAAYLLCKPRCIRSAASLWLSLNFQAQGLLPSIRHIAANVFPPPYCTWK